MSCAVSSHRYPFVQLLYFADGFLNRKQLQKFDFSQFGATNGPKLLGPVRGVLPIGRNGIQVFDMLHPSPLSDPRKLSGMLSYSYMLENQSFRPTLAVNMTNKALSSLNRPLQAVVVNTLVRYTLAIASPVDYPTFS